MDPIVSFIDIITIGLRTTEESHASDSSTAVITLTISHIIQCTYKHIHIRIRIRIHYMVMALKKRRGWKSDKAAANVHMF